jgi:choline dehydrogenase
MAARREAVSGRGEGGKRVTEGFDFIIVGAGSAGCVLADRLTASGRHRVLLLEAGPGNLHPWLHIPLGFGRLFTDRRYNWCYETIPQPECHNRNVIAPRGKVLGGSSSINGLIYIRGQAEDFDYWRQLGNAGWSFADVLPYFRKAENNERGADEFHGAGGPLGVSDLRDRHPLAVAYVEAAVQCGYPRNDDFNGPVQEGAGYYQTTMSNGVRSSAAHGYLKAARRRANLKVVSKALATRILFDGRRATGVEYLVGNDKRGAHANVEVIVASGAFNSPQLLQLSGVGPASLLQALGIPVVADAPGVGDDLNDHISGRIILRCKDPITLNDAVRNWSGKLTHGLHYVLTRRGYLAIPAVSSAVFLRALPSSGTPDSQCSISLFSAGTIGGELSPYPGVTGNCVLLRPESRGYVKIKSADPHEAPAIHPNYLATPKDRETITAGVNAMRRIFQAPRHGALHRRRDRAGRAMRQRRGIARFHPPPRLHHLSSGGHLPHGPGPQGRGRRAAARARIHRPARDRRLDHAGGGFRQHQCGDDHDRREGCGYDPGGYQNRFSGRRLIAKRAARSRAAARRSPAAPHRRLASRCPHR